MEHSDGAGMNCNADLIDEYIDTVRQNICRDFPSRVFTGMRSQIAQYDWHNININCPLDACQSVTAHFHEHIILNISPNMHVSVLRMFRQM